MTVRSGARGRGQAGVPGVARAGRDPRDRLDGQPCRRHVMDVDIAVLGGPLMSTIAELGSFLASGQAAATRALPPGSDTTRPPTAPMPSRPAARWI
jgi:hypothetical protein